LDTYHPPPKGSGRWIRIIPTLGEWALDTYHPHPRGVGMIRISPQWATCSIRAKSPTRNVIRVYRNMYYETYVILITLMTSETFHMVIIRVTTETLKAHLHSDHGNVSRGHYNNVPCNVSHGHYSNVKCNVACGLHSKGFGCFSYCPVG